MKNREWLNNMALIDLLELANGAQPDDRCIIDNLENNLTPTKCRAWECYDCLCKWLNEEVKSHEKQPGK